MSSLEQFVVFKEVAEVGNITQASKRLHISQPSVSVQIKNLEHEFGAELFNRTYRGVTLTHPGTILYDKVVSILHAIDQAKEEISDYCAHQNALIHVGATLTIGEYLLPRIMSLTLDDHTQPRFNAHIANTSAIVNEVLDKELGIGLIEGPVDDSDELDITPFWHDELVLIVSTDHPWANRSEVTFDELTHENFIAREKGSGTRTVAELGLAKSGFDISKLNVIMELSSTQAIKETVLANLGVSILSALTVQEECRQGRLVMLRLKDCTLTRPLNLIVRSKSTPSPEEQWLIDRITDHALLSTILPRPSLPPQVDSSISEGAPADENENKSADAKPDLQSTIAGWSDLSDNERIICHLINDKKSQSSAELAKNLDMTQRDVLTLLHNLIDKNIIEGYGGSKNHRYRFTSAATNNK